MAEESKATVDILALQAETLLAIVNQCLMSGEVAPINNPVEEWETPIGELTPFEKAIYTAKFNLAQSNNEMVKEALDNGGNPDLSEVERNRQDHETLNTLFWGCIKHRLGLSSTEHEDIGIREGYKIVSFPVDVSELVGEMLANSLMSIAIGFGEEGSHNCEKCQKYDTCDYPFKEERIARA